MTYEFGPGFNPNEASLEQAAIPEITEAHCRIEMTRGGGSGGQKRNKTSNRIQLWWNPDDDARFSAEQTVLIKEELKNRMNKRGEIMISSENERSMEQNKNTALALLNELVARALTPQKERIETRPTRSSKERRLSEKESQGRKKKERQWRRDE